MLKVRKYVLYAKGEMELSNNNGAISVDATPGPMHSQISPALGPFRIGCGMRRNSNSLDSCQM